MSEKMWKLKEGVKLEENEDDPVELREVVNAGMAAMDKLFDH